MATSSQPLHVAMFPWLAFGHLIPFLELAKRIAQKGHRISFISTSRNIDRLPKLPQSLAPFITFVELSLPHVENLPENAEATIDVSFHQVQFLKKAFDGLHQPLKSFLEASSPDWIVYDFAHCWLPSIAAKLGISRAFFNILNSWSVCFFGSSSTALINGEDPRKKPEHFTVPPSWVPFPTKLAFRLPEANRYVEGSVEVNFSEISDTCRLGWAILGCDVIVSRSCMELESDWTKLLGELHQKPVISAGLLPPNSITDQVFSQDNTWLSISEWLDKQKTGSVVYIALGSEVTLSQEQLIELALGLELSGLPFFWVCRKLHGSVDEFPGGFEERIKGDGIVWRGWAPQLRILGHESVGGFLTHCGWSSIIEGLHFGRALIMLPFQLDQGLNARVFEEKMVGKEVPRDERNGSFTSKMVAETLGLVMVEDDGGICREKAKEMKKIFGDKLLHDRYVDNLLEYLQNYN